MHREPMFDTLVDDSEIDRNAFNAAFYELGLRWHWSSEDFAELARHASERARIRRYVETEHPHLLAVYSTDSLADAVLSAKTRYRELFSARPEQAMPRFNWTDSRWGEIGI